VKTPTQPGSLSEWVRPDSPRVSYSVAMVIPTDIQACCMSCHVGLKRCEYPNLRSNKKRRVACHSCVIGSITKGRKMK